MDREMRKYVEDWFSEKGIKALEARLESLVRIYNETPDNAYPLTIPMFGFPTLQIKDPNELIGRIRELGDLIDFNVEVNKK